MKILICIDDTDNKESKGTGQLAAALSDRIRKRGWGEGGGITRHQLFVHPDVPYTSHNSAMCFPFTVANDQVGSLISLARAFLAEHGAPGSDPGLCVVDRAALAATDTEALIAFGKSAKSSVLRKQDALVLAQQLGIHLSENGGTGDGVIGALAGVGLRLSGNDGRFRGHYPLGDPGQQLAVAEIKARTPVEVVRALDGTRLSDDDPVALGPKVKAVLLGHTCTLLVFRPERARGSNTPSPWHTCSKEQLRSY